MKRQLLTGVLAASTLTLAAFSQANPAHAVSLGPNPDVATAGSNIPSSQNDGVSANKREDEGKGKPKPVPTPALLPAVLGMGAAVLRKKKQEAKVAEKV